jgi:hypothetical protein
MRAIPLLAAFAALDLVVVAIAGITHPEGPAMSSMRIPIGGIVAVTVGGLAALMALSQAARWLDRLDIAPWRTLGGVLLGAAYGAAIVGALAWTALWLSPEYAPVALAGLACAGLLSWQSWAEAEMSAIHGNTGARADGGHFH